jgi:hypothetical protein
MHGRYQNKKEYYFFVYWPNRYANYLIVLNILLHLIPLSP